MSIKERYLFIGRDGADSFPVKDKIDGGTYAVCKSEREALTYIKNFDWDDPPAFLREPMLGGAVVAQDVSVSENPIPAIPKQPLDDSLRVPRSKTKSRNIRRRK